MYRRDIQLALKQEKDRTNETAMRPLRKATIDKFPEYIDPRLRNYRSRYGAISNN
ncbi:phage anti-RecBCD protein, partial [Escherichia coli]